MATQNIIQYLETSQYNALPSGGTVPVGIEAMNRRQIETFIASEAIAVGDTVALDFSKAGSGDKGIFVVKCDQGTATKKCGVGVAISAATAAGDTVDAVIAGMVDNAKVAGATAVGDAMAVSGATTGELAVYAAGDTLPVFAIAATAHAGGTATVFVIKQF